MKTILGAGIILGGLYFWAKNKAGEVYNNFSQTVENLTYQIVNIKNLDWSGGVPFFGNDPKIKFLMDLKISNPTNHSWNVQGGSMVSLVRIEFLSLDNKTIAIARPQVNAVNLPANGSAIFQNIPTEIPVTDINLFSSLSNFSKDNFKIRPTINVAGTNYTLNQN